MQQNLFQLFTSDPVEYTLKDFKCKLVIAIITVVRERGWSQARAAEELGISRPRMSNLFHGHLDKFSIDMLMGWMVRLGYSAVIDFQPTCLEAPLEIAMCKIA